MSAAPRHIAAMKLATLTFVLNDGEDDGDRFQPVNQDAKLVSVKARSRAPQTIAAFVSGSTRNPHAIARKAASLKGSSGMVFVFKAQDEDDDARREVVGIISKSGVVDGQGDVVDRAALREAAYDLAQRIGQKAGVSIDANHDPNRQLDDVALVQCWMGGDGVGDPDSLYARFAFPDPSATYDAIKRKKCSGFSWQGPVNFA